MQKHGIGAWEKMRHDPDFKVLKCVPRARTERARPAFPRAPTPTRAKIVRWLDRATQESLVRTARLGALVDERRNCRRLVSRRVGRARPLSARLAPRASYARFEPALIPPLTLATHPKSSQGSNGRATRRQMEKSDKVPAPPARGLRARRTRAARAGRDREARPSARRLTTRGARKTPTERAARARARAPGPYPTLPPHPPPQPSAPPTVVSDVFLSLVRHPRAQLPHVSSHILARECASPQTVSARVVSPHPSPPPFPRTGRHAAPSFRSDPSSSSSRSPPSGKKRKAGASDVSAAGRGAKIPAGKKPSAAEQAKADAAARAQLAPPVEAPKKRFKSAMHHQLAGREPPRAPEDIALAPGDQRDGERVETIRARRDAAAKEVTAAEQNLMGVKTSVEDAEAIYNNVRAELAAGHGYGDDHDDDEHHVEDDWDKYLHFGDHDHGDDDGGAGSTPRRGNHETEDGDDGDPDCPVSAAAKAARSLASGYGATCNPRRRRGDAGRGRGGGARARKPPRAAPRTRRARTRARTRRAALADAGITGRGGEPAPSPGKFRPSLQEAEAFLLSNSRSSSSPTRG